MNGEEQGKSKRQKNNVKHYLRKWTCPFAYVCIYFAFSNCFSPFVLPIACFCPGKKMQKKSAIKNQIEKITINARKMQMDMFTC